MQKKILIVDDEPDLIDILKQRLESRFRIISAPNGREGFDKAVTERPDLILSDILMPEADGYSLFTQLKKHVQTKDIPVVFISALGESSEILKATQMGVADYLIKPLHLDELPDLVKKYSH